MKSNIISIGVSSIMEDHLIKTAHLVDGTNDTILFNNI
jgi:hypothetical protein